MRIARNAAVFVFSCGVFACSSSSSSAPGTDPGTDTGTTPTTDTGVTPTDDTNPPPPDTNLPATYADGPYGFKVGNIFPNMTLKLYKEGNAGDGSFEDHSMLEYYDPDGVRGITAIYLVVAAQWCGPCNTEADHMPSWWVSDYQARGAKFVSVVIQSASTVATTVTCTDSTTCNCVSGVCRVYADADQKTVDQWVAKHKINFDIGLDTSKKLAAATPALPNNFVIDPRTMKVVKIIQGIDPAVKPCTDSSTCCNSTNDPKHTTCNKDYLCSPTLKSCIDPVTTGPLTVYLDRVMDANGAPPFDTGLAK